MLNRQSSKKCTPSPATPDLKTTQRRNKKKKKQIPLQDLNNGISRNNSTSSTSSSMSIDAPMGCLRFFLSNPSSSKPSLHRPRSLSSSRSRPSKENHLPKPSRKNPPCLYQWHSGKKPTSATAPKSNPSPDLRNPLNNSASGSQREPESKKEFNQSPGEINSPYLNYSGNVVQNCTPVGKLAIGIDKKSEEEESNTSTGTTTTTTKTPPVQASVSPEIQCGSSIKVSTTTPTCYGAGHVVSGVTDRRKCRPRGILTVGGIDSSISSKANVFDNGNDGNDSRVLKNSRVSLIPLPAEASMSWLLSPHENEEGQEGDSENGLRKFPKLAGSATLDLPSSPSSCHGYGSNLGNYSGMGTSNTDSASSSRTTRITLLSPRILTGFQGLEGGTSSDKVPRRSSSVSPRDTPSCKAVVHSQEERKYPYNFPGENSPFSIDSLSSGNVIQTPKSDSSSERGVGLSWSNADGHHKHHFESELSSVAEVLRRASLSPRSHISLCDPPGLSFQFADLTSPSNSIDLNQLQKNLENRAYCVSDSTLENVPQSQMRISWREGLISRIFEMDEFDCCRCLSDEENDTYGCSNDQLEKSNPSLEFNADLPDDHCLNNGFRSHEFLDHEMGVDEKGKEKLHRPNSLQESISTDGGGLVASGDSDWSLCYRNQLFEL